MVMMGAPAAPGAESWSVVCRQLSLNVPVPTVAPLTEKAPPDCMVMNRSPVGAPAPDREPWGSAEICALEPMMHVC
jgi:hypothetical protein